MRPSKSLEKFGSDKVTAHHYGQFYDHLFSKLTDPFDILEIGVLDGASIRAWRDSFPKSNITAIDLFESGEPLPEDVKFIRGDIKQIKLEGKFDVIIDDSSHDLRESLWEIQNILGNLKEGGVFVVEDIQIPDLYVSEMRKVLPEGFTLETHDFRPLTEGAKHDDFIVKIFKK